MSDDTSKKGMQDRTRINTSGIACRAPKLVRLNQIVRHSTSRSRGYAN